MHIYSVHYALVQCSQVPNKRVYSIIIFGFFSHPVFGHVMLFPTLLVYFALLILLFHPTPSFGPIFYEIYTEYPPYSFIWPYLFNWHLRVAQKVLERRSSSSVLCGFAKHSNTKQLTKCQFLSLNVSQLTNDPSQIELNRWSKF